MYVCTVCILCMYVSLCMYIMYNNNNVLITYLVLILTVPLTVLLLSLRSEDVRTFFLSKVTVAELSYERHDDDDDVCTPTPNK